MNKVTFNGEVCTVVLSRYSGGNICLKLIDANGIPFANSSVHSRLPLDDNEVIIKSYAENEGMFEALLKAGIVELVDTMETGLVTVHLCRVLVELPKNE